MAPEDELQSPPKNQREEDLPLDDVIDFLNDNHIDLKKLSQPNKKPNIPKVPKNRN